MNSTRTKQLGFQPFFRAWYVIAFAMLVLMWLHANAKQSGTVITIAGNGTVGFSGDGGPATNAALSEVEALTIGPDGTIYMVDGGNYRIRAIDPATGYIRTVAGDGVPSNTGNGGLATNASISGTTSLAVDRTRNVLYLSDINNNVVRRINLADGIISIYAGTGTIGFTGDGGAATAARVRRPWGLATDAAGKLSLAAQYRVRQVNPVTGIINTIAGNENSDFAPDGFPAISTTFHGITELAADPAGNVFIFEGFSNEPRFVRRVDVVSGLVSTVAGGGTNAPGSGVATNMQFIDMFDIAVSSAGELFIAMNFQLFRVDLATGLIAPIAGDGIQGYGGDGGPALAARFDNMGALAAIPGGGVVVADVQNFRIRYIAPDSINLTNDSGQTMYTLPWLSSVQGDLVISNNSSLTNISVSGVTNVGRVINIGANASASVIDLSSLANVSGNLTLSSNASAAVIYLTALTSYGCGTNEVIMTLEGTVEMTNGLTLCSNATLRGSATIQGSVTNHGIIEPGSSPGRLNISSHLHLGGSSRLRLEINGYASNRFDVVAVGSNLVLDGNLSVALVEDFKWVMTNGASFTVLTAGASLSGAFANAASGGQITTTDGYARFTLLSTGGNVRLADLEIVDSDSDGMPNWWEDHFGLSITNAIDAGLDLDGDGAANAAEFTAGTDPTNPASVFRILAIQAESNGVRLTWNGVGGKTYRVQTNGTLTDAFGDNGAVVVMPGTGTFSTNVLNAYPITNGQSRYYRLRVGQ